MNKAKICVLFFANIILTSLIQVLEDYFEIKTAEPNMDKLSSPLALIFAALIIAPLLEEFCFRYPLKKQIGFYYSLVFCSIFLSMLPTWVFLSGVVFNISIFFLYQFKKVKQLPILMVIISNFLFTLIHVGNFTIESLNNLNYFELCILFSPHFFVGLALSIIRMKSRFLYAVYYHFAYNLFIIGTALLFD